VTSDRSRHHRCQDDGVKNVTNNIGVLAGIGLIVGALCDIGVGKFTPIPEDVSAAPR